MSRATILIVALLSLTLCTASTAQVPQSFLTLPHHSVATTDDALSPLVNPAGLGVENGGSSYLMAPYSSNGQLEDWGFAVGGEGIGFVGEYLRNSMLPNDMSRYTLGFGGGDDGLYFGAAFSSTKGLDRENNWDVGMLYRPYNFFSFGAVARGINNPRVGMENGKVGWDVGLAIRPLALTQPIGGDLGHRLTLTADANLREFTEITGLREEEKYFDNMGYKFGASMEFLPGLVGHVDFLNEIGDGMLSRDKQLWAGVSFGFGGGPSGSGEVGMTQQDGKGAGSGWIAHHDLARPSFIDKLNPKEQNRVVVIKLNGPIVEYNQSSSWFRPKSRTVHGFTKQINKLGEDPSVSGIIIRMEGFSAGFARIQEMRVALENFKATGKTIAVYGEHYGNGSYYLASVADKIYLAKTSGLGLTGLAANMQFLRGTLDWIGIDPELEHIGKYKSYSDMLTRDDMSDAQKEATDAILDGLYGELVAAIADGRGMSEDDIRKLIDDGGEFTADDAYKADLIDSLIYEDQLEDIVKELAETKKEFNIVSEKKYNMKKMADPEWQDIRKKSVAIVYALGSITSGNSSDGGLFGSGSMGSNTIVKALRDAREDDDVKAIVFRVDSPGGSGLASEMILREVERTTTGDDAKPFIVSMGDVAGSGGYYIACKADTIIAQPNTITGSIGVISGKFSFAELYKKIKVNNETLKRGKYADMYSTSRSFTEDERAKLRDQIQQFYDIFVQNVADGRGMDTSEVNNVGQGRIWTGTDAKERGLVDLTGGLELAIEIAAKSAGIKEGEKFNIKKFPRNHGKDKMMQGMRTLVRTTLPDEVVNLADKVTNDTKWKDGEILFLMPYQMDIE